MFNKKTDIKKERAEQIKEVCAIASICLNDDKFRQYRDRYLMIKQSLIEDMLECQEQDPIKYALEMNTLSVKIKTLGLLLGSITDDTNMSKKGDAA